MFESETAGGGSTDKFELVKSYISDLGYLISHEDAAEELVVIQDEDAGIKNLVVDCESPIVILEQMILEVPANPGNLYLRLLQMNRTLVHGAFVIDEDARHVIFRDTLQLANIDLNEIEGSLSALSLALVEHGEELLGFARS